MDFKKLGNILAIIGASVLVAAVAWWFTFYSNVVGELRNVPGVEPTASVRDMWRCLYSSDGLCALISGAANLIGKTPYEPMTFWAGLVGLIVGVVVRLAAKPQPA